MCSSDLGHMGVEADLTALESRELDELARGIALHKEWRDLLHSGDSIRFDSDTSVVAHGLYAPERREALVSIARVAEVGGPVRLRLPELLPETTYRARVILGSAAVEVATITGRDASDDGMVVTGLAPWSAVLVHLSAS